MKAQPPLNYEEKNKLSKFFHFAIVQKGKTLYLLFYA